MNYQAQRNYRSVFWLLAVLGVTLDLTAKYVIFAVLFTGGWDGAQELVPGAFRLSTQYDRTRDAGTDVLSSLRTVNGEALPRVNEGALFGLGHGKNNLFTIVSLVAAMGIIYWSTRPGAGKDFFLTVSLGLILAGTLGNLYDRVVFGGVRDFLHWYYLVDWPVFNIADCCLVCGASLLLIQAVLYKPKNADDCVSFPSQETSDRMAPASAQIQQQEVAEVK